MGVVNVSLDLAQNISSYKFSWTTHYRIKLGVGTCWDLILHYRTFHLELPSHSPWPKLDPWTPTYGRLQPACWRRGWWRRRRTWPRNQVLILIKSNICIYIYLFIYVCLCK
jgi:hypothetical protein